MEIKVVVMDRLLMEGTAVGTNTETLATTIMETQEEWAVVTMQILVTVVQNKTTTTGVNQTQGEMLTDNPVGI